jgi:hypothetical protein
MRWRVVSILIARKRPHFLKAGSPRFLLDNKQFEVCAVRQIVLGGWLQTTFFWDFDICFSRGRIVVSPQIRGV